MNEECRDHRERYRLPSARPAVHLRMIPMFGGRPERDCPITREDIMDLKIALYTAKSLSQFLASV